MNKSIEVIQNKSSFSWAQRLYLRYGNIFLGYFRKNILKTSSFPFSEIKKIIVLYLYEEKDSSLFEEIEKIQKSGISCYCIGISKKQEPPVFQSMEKSIAFGMGDLDYSFSLKKKASEQVVNFFNINDSYDVLITLNPSTFSPLYFFGKKIKSTYKISLEEKGREKGKENLRLLINPTEKSKKLGEYLGITYEYLKKILPA